MRKYSIAAGILVALLLSGCVTGSYCPVCGQKAKNVSVYGGKSVFSHDATEKIGSHSWAGH
jgi:hypothetical protein